MTKCKHCGEEIIKDRFGEYIHRWNHYLTCDKGIAKPSEEEKDVR